MTISDYVRKWAKINFNEQDAWLVRNRKASVWIRSGQWTYGVTRPRLSKEHQRVTRIFVGVEWLQQQLPTTFTIAKLQGKLPRPEQAQTGVGKMTVHPSEAMV